MAELGYIAQEFAEFFQDEDFKDPYTVLDLFNVDYSYALYPEGSNPLPTDTPVASFIIFEDKSYAYVDVTKKTCHHGCRLH